MSNPSPETIRRAEEALATSLRRLRLYETVLSTTPDLVYIFGLDHRFLYANEALLKMWGKTWDEAIGLNCLELGYAPWHASMHDREIEQVVATKAPLQGVVPFTGTNGRRLYEYLFAPVIGMDGSVEAVAGTTRDVTDRQAMEAALRESEEFNRAILENSPDCVKVLDLQGRLELMNLPGSRMMEIEDFTSFRGREWASLWPEENRAQVVSAVQAAAQAGETVRFEGCCPTIKGSPRWWDVIVTPVRDAGGKVWRLLSVSRDVTANKAAEQQLSMAKAAAEAASKAKDEFLATLSHELRTPLNPVLLLAVEAERNETLPPSVRADFATIRRNVELEARLIDDLLDLTRISSGKLRLARQPLDAHEFLQACIRFVAPEIEAKGLQLVRDLAAKEAWVEADPVRLQQIFWNILRNAVKFTPANGQVTLRSRSSGGKLIVEVEDTGVGIGGAELSTIFEAFQQGRGGNELGGLGLGLAITRALVEHHGGALRPRAVGRVWVPPSVSSFRCRSRPPRKRSVPGHRGRQPLRRSCGVCVFCWSKITKIHASPCNACWSVAGTRCHPPVACGPPELWRRRPSSIVSSLTSDCRMGTERR